MLLAEDFSLMLGIRLASEPFVGTARSNVCVAAELSRSTSAMLDRALPFFFQSSSTEEGDGSPAWAKTPFCRPVGPAMVACGDGRAQEVLEVD
ncbi:hypothetical protein N7539_007479 [Penicillium diatomitis]|uniref:Uncharacterized protein n=1 Tax=Penicillium diatomitis TaxID=2819901 RepID=A0A9X0BNY4_9EURO|nr:uncharacterized protein N7539_007479 [Penicillium diatomitis]KAJ5477335.1 hypothetical protein N7539_007479 [Penicillium diatomitis]